MGNAGALMLKIGSVDIDYVNKLARRNVFSHNGVDTPDKHHERNLSSILLSEVSSQLPQICPTTQRARNI